MKTTLSVFSTMLIALFALSLNAQTNHTKTVKIKKMETVKQSKEVVQEFFNAFSKRDFNGIINTFHDSSTITAVRDASANGSQIYGTYHGKEGLKSFLANLGTAFDTKAFSVNNVIGEGKIAFANGKFTHIVKATGKPYSSDWALMCVIKDDKIFEYHFYEDSEKFSEASK